MLLRGGVEVAERCTPAHANASRHRIDAHLLHPRQVDHQPAVHCPEARDVVTAPTHRERQAGRACRGYRCTHVVGRRTPRNRRRMLPVRLVRLRSPTLRGRNERGDRRRTPRLAQAPRLARALDDPTLMRRQLALVRGYVALLFGVPAA
jgi:hypothetical protein